MASSDGVQFVDTFMPELIQNVTAVEAIAEALKSKNMIHQEAYSEICALPTSEKKMRKLFEAMRSGGRIVKAKFYKLLMENHPHLVAQLEETQMEEQPMNATDTLHLREPPKNVQSARTNVYKMTSKPRGYCVIINNKNFIRLKNRKGTDQDALLLKETFEWLGFLVELYEDQTAERMRSIMEDYSKKCHTDNDCFVACLLSHGKQQVVCGTDGGLVTVEEILKPFEGNMCSALLTKPKVFFIQACQGSDRQGFVTLQEDSPGDRSLEDDGLIKIPVQADFLIGMSTVQGCKSMRNERSGTWYIQSLCQRLKAHCPKGVDVLTILTDVNHDVSRNDGVIKEDGKSVPAKQIPELRSTLTSTLVFPVPE